MAKQLREQIVKGKKFEDVAANYSEDPGSGQKGGDLGWFGRSQMVKSFEDAAFSLKVGEISQPIMTTFGFHLIQVLEKDPKHPLDVQTLAQKRGQAYQEWLQEQIRAPSIEWPDDLAPKLPPLSIEAVSTWEYQGVDGGSALGGGSAGIANLLNPLGKAGWDMGGVTGPFLIMKRTPANPDVWEYQMVNGNPAAVATLLNPPGKAGWEVAGVTTTFFILKRPLTNPGAWEYQSVELAGDPASTTALLNPLGKDGWDMAGITGPFLILKRPLANPAAWAYQIVDGGGALLSGDPAGVANLLNPLG